MQRISPEVAQSHPMTSSTGEEILAVAKFLQWQQRPSSWHQQGRGWHRKEKGKVAFPCVIKLAASLQYVFCHEISEISWRGRIEQQYKSRNEISM